MLFFQIFLKKYLPVFPKILSSTSIFNIDNNKKDWSD